MRKKRINGKALLLLILFPLVGMMGCNEMDPSDDSSFFTGDEKDLLPEDADYTAEPGATPFLAGKIWQLDGILDLKTNTIRKLTLAGADSYSMRFDSDSTAAGKIIDTEMQVGLSRPFFRFKGTKESSPEAQLFAEIASGITGCDYRSFEDSLMRFYNKDNKTCLVFKFKGVRDKTGTMVYQSLGSQTTEEGEWRISSHSETRVILYDGGEYYLPEDIPDNFKQVGLEVKFSGDVTQTYRRIEMLYSINLFTLTTDEDVTGESTHVTDLSGTLSYYPGYQMWGVRHTIPGTIDSVDLYLIKEDMKDLSTDTSLAVVFSGDYFLSKLKPSLGGLTIYNIINFKYKQL
jgi:hypothetical protein